MIIIIYFGLTRILNETENKAALYYKKCINNTLKLITYIEWNNRFSNTEYN